MGEPRYGICRDCACWRGEEQDALGERSRRCLRSSPRPGYYARAVWPLTADNEGCFDHIPKKLATDAKGGER